MKSKPTLIGLMAPGLVIAGVWWLNTSREKHSTATTATEHADTTSRSQRPSSPSQEARPTNPPSSTSESEAAKEMDRLRIVDQLLGTSRVPVRLLKWLETDPDAAFEWALRTGNDDEDHSGFVVQMVAESDLEKAIAMLKRLTHPNSISHARFAIIRKLAADDPEAARSYLAQETDSSFIPRMHSIIAEELAKRDRADAMKRFEKAEAGYERLGLAAGVAAAWAEEDLPATLAWVEQLSTMEKNWALSKIAPHWVTADPPAAMAYFAAHSDHDSPSSAFNTALESWVRLDPQAALEWLKQSSHSQDTLAFSTFFTEWSMSDPAKTAEAAKDIADEELRDLIVLSSIENLAARSAQEAARLADSIDPHLLNTAMPAILKQWIPQDPRAAAAWITALEDESAQERGTLILTLFASADHPSLASDWLGKINNPNTREALLNRVGPLWLNHDEPEGHRLLLEAGVSPERIAEMQEQLHELR